MTKITHMLMSGAIGIGVALGASVATAAPTVEVLHWWTSGGEAAAIADLKTRLEAKGVMWQDMPVAGGAGTNAEQALIARVTAGNPPDAVLMKGAKIQEWHEEYGAFGDAIDVTAMQEGWNDVLPGSIAKGLKCDGAYCAAAVNIHRVDWVWSNPEVLAKVGVMTPPTNWDEFNATADKLKAAGITALAHGGQAWQDATVFEVIAITLGGPQFYHNAFVELDNRAIQSETMVKVFEQFRKLRGYVDRSFQGRDWNLATSMVMNGNAGFQIMGDWAKGEFTIAGKKPGVDYNCSAFGKGYISNADGFVFFEASDMESEKAQQAMASVIMSVEFQESFNLKKGSIPARTDMDLSNFDSCAKKSHADIVKASENGGLQPSLTHGMAQPGTISGAVTDVVTNFFNSDQSAEDGVRALVAAIDAER